MRDDDQAGEQGRQYITELKKISDRISPVPPPAHDLTEYWKAGGDLREWTGGHILPLLERALEQPGLTHQERARKILAAIRMERLRLQTTCF